MSYILMGLDAGQSDTNVAVRSSRASGGKGTIEYLTFPSLIAGGDPSRLHHLYEAIMTNGSSPYENPHDWMVVEIGQTPIYVGELAFQGRNPTTRRGDPERYAGGHTLRLLLAACGRLIAMGRMPNDAAIRLVTGLPLEWHVPQRKAAVQRSLVGTHEYRYLDRRCRITIDAVGVLPEGPVLLHATAHLAVHQAAIDCGWGTTEVYWAFGKHPDPRRSSGYKTGVGRIADEINAALRMLPRGGRTLSERDMRRVLRAYLANQPYPDDLVSRDIRLAEPLAQIVPHAVQTVQQEILGYIGSTWGDDGGTIAIEAHTVRFSGGGAYFFGQAVRDLIPQVHISAQPEFDTAAAYLAVAEAATDTLWERNRG